MPEIMPVQRRTLRVLMTCVVPAGMGTAGGYAPAGIGETLGGHQQSWFTPAFEQCVGGDGGAHLDRDDPVGRQIIVGSDAKHASYPLYRGVATAPPTIPRSRP